MVKNKKGVVLIISLMVIAVLLVLVGVYLSGLLTEKRAADTEEFVLQALNLAEAGAGHGQAELRERMRQDLKAAVEPVTQPSVFQAYTASCLTALNFLRDYAYASGDTQFSVPQLVGGEYQTTLDLSPLNLNSAVQGTYAAKIIIKCNGNPTNPESGVFIFPYKYNIESQGSITRTTPNIVRKTALLYGTFSVRVQRGNFAKYALFTNHHRTPSGTTVWFTGSTNFTGPVHTNERFSFANNPSGHFTANVSQHLTTARFYNNGITRLLDADTNPVCCERETCETVPCRDKPIFDAGFTRGADLINLPSSVTQQDLKNQATGGQNDGPWANGIYLPDDGSNNLVGGVYIKGNASNLTMSVENNQPVYTIIQGTNTKKITVDYTNNQTIVTNISGSGGTAPGTYNGIPNGINNQGIIIYDNGSISNFSGTVQSDTAVTVSSNSDIVINNHLMYQDYTPDNPETPENELSAADTGNLLGILTWNGNVRIGTSAPPNLNIHGVVMAAGRNGVFTVDNYQSGSPRGVVSLLGGVITDFYGAFGTFIGTYPVSGYGRNFVYDGRMLEGMSPPSFPTTLSFDAAISDADMDGVDDLGDKLIWQDRGV